MNPTLYDILGVSADAPREEIRAAWRAAADRFEPGEGGSGKQFRLFNEAAEVLLDPQRRAEYDARLAADHGSNNGSDHGSDHGATGSNRGADAGSDTGTVERGTAVLPDAPLPGSAHAAAVPSRTSAETDPVTRSAPPGGATGDPTSDATGSAPPRRGRRLPWLVMVPLALVTAAGVALAAYLTVEANRAEAYEQALGRAPAAAESAAVAVLAYDFETLEADRDAAAKFLTPEYREDYVETFDALVVDSASETEASVEAEVLASAPMAVSGERDPDRVNVLLFVNQVTTSTATSGDPSRALNRVRFEMVRVDGGWLVDDITSY